MTRLSQMLAVGAITLAPLLASTAALAVTCDITNTGPGSNNQCTSTAKYTCTIDNNNTLKVFNGNTQVATSGNATTNNNTTSGSATSGSAANGNLVTYSATIDNSGACSVVATTAPVTPVSGGQGATTPAAPVVQTVTPAAGKGAALAVLPNTSSDSTLPFMAGLIGLFGAGVVVSRLAVVAYSRIRS